MLSVVELGYTDHMCFGISNTSDVFLWMLISEWTECMLFQVVQADEAAANTAAQEAQAIKVPLE